MKYVELELYLFRYWDALPEPKKDVVQWYYSEGGIRDMLMHYHEVESEYEDRFKLKEKIKEVKSAASENGV